MPIQHSPTSIAGAQALPDVDNSVANTEVEVSIPIEIDQQFNLEEVNNSQIFEQHRMRQELNFVINELRESRIVQIDLQKALKQRDEQIEALKTDNLALQNSTLNNNSKLETNNCSVANEIGLENNNSVSNQISTNSITTVSNVNNNLVSNPSHNGGNLINVSCTKAYNLQNFTHLATNQYGINYNSFPNSLGVTPVCIPVYCVGQPNFVARVPMSAYSMVPQGGTFVTPTYPNPVPSPVLFSNPQTQSGSIVNSMQNLSINNQPTSGFNQVQFVTLAEPTVFKSLSKRDFNEFLGEFNDFLIKSGSFASNEDRKIYELRKYVESDLQQKIDNLSNSGVGYNGIIEQLNNDIKKFRKQLKEKYLEQFDRLVRGQNENFEMLARRIESEGQRAYPELNLTSDALSKKLIIKLMSCNGMSEFDTFKIQQTALKFSDAPSWDHYRRACKVIDDNNIEFPMQKNNVATYPITYAESVRSQPAQHIQMQCNVRPNNYARIPGLQPYPSRPLPRAGMIPNRSMPPYRPKYSGPNFQNVNINYDVSCLSKFPCAHCKDKSHNLKYCQLLSQCCRLCGNTQHNTINCSKMGPLN